LGHDQVLLLTGNRSIEGPSGQLREGPLGQGCNESAQHHVNMVACAPLFTAICAAGENKRQLDKARNHLSPRPSCHRASTTRINKISQRHSTPPFSASRTHVRSATRGCLARHRAPSQQPVPCPIHASPIPSSAVFLAAQASIPRPASPFRLFAIDQDGCQPLRIPFRSVIRRA